MFDNYDYNIIKVLISLMSSKNREIKPFEYSKSNEKNKLSSTLNNKPKENDVNTLLSKHFNKTLQYKILRIRKEFDFVEKNSNKYQLLTKREKEIILTLAQGYNNLEISKKLNISRYTVEQHRKNINRKLEITSFSHLMSYAYAFDII